MNFHFLDYWISIEYVSENEINEIASNYGYSNPKLKKFTVMVWKRTRKIPITSETDSEGKNNE